MTHQDLPPRPTLADSILILGFPVAVWLALTALGNAAGEGVSPTFSSYGLIGTLVLEGLFFAIMVPRLRRRGWRASHVSLPFRRRDIPVGMAIFVAAYAVYAVAFNLVAAFRPDIASSMRGGYAVGRPALAVVVAASLVNPIYEELLWLGYVVPGPARWRVLPAVMLSLIPRCLIHMYQGWAAIVAVGPIGALYLAYFLRTGRLWPVIIAHAPQDLVGLALLRARS